MAEQLKGSAVEEARNLFVVNIYSWAEICIFRNEGDREVNGAIKLRKALARAKLSSRT